MGTLKYQGLTIACITGGIAEVMFGLPDEIAEASRAYLTDDLVEVVDRFAIACN